jgi:predicted nuclease of restriction endonuclease-like (RecB) superfamily
MRQFYLAFPISHEVRDGLEKRKIPHAVRGELTWTHYRLLLKVDNAEARKFYVQESIDGNWSTRQLERQINSFYYERLVSSRIKLPVKKEAADNAKKLVVEPRDIIKDPYVLEFLDLNSSIKHIESDLESAIIGKLQQFLLELGKGFCFIARQKRISAEDDHFYVDLVFYNHILKCFLLIDLKTGKLNHQDIGQMDFYVRYFEDKIKTEGDNPTIGLILCAEKNATIAKYSVLNDSKHLFASKYRLYLPSEKELSREIQREKEMVMLENKLSRNHE